MIFVGIWLDILDMVEFHSWSISIQIKLKEIQSLNGRLNIKRSKHCVDTFGPVAFIMQKNHPGYFGNSPNPSLKNTILMVITNATAGNFLFFGV